MIRIVSWNMARRDASWAVLRDTQADIALLQEAGRPDPSWQHALADSSDGNWETALVAGKGKWRTAVIKLSDRVELRPRPTMTLETATSAGDWVVSRSGSIAAADIIVGGQYVLSAVSVYAAWEKVGSRGYADGSAHRILSDLSALTLDRRLRLIVAGDWNLLKGYGEHGDDYWRARYDTVFLGPRLSVSDSSVPSIRMAAEPIRGRRSFQLTACASRRSTTLDSDRRRRRRSWTSYSPRLHWSQQVRVRALNKPGEWGPSDHCRVVVDVDL